MSYTVPQTTWYRPTAPWDFNGGVFSALQREFGQMFDDFGNFPSYKGFRNAVPYVNVVETDNAFELEAELPGYDEKDVEVLLREDVLTIKGNKKATFEGNGNYNYYIHERSLGTFTRSIELPFEPDPSAMKVTFSKGILRIMWPKSAAMKGRTIKIPIHH